MQGRAAGINNPRDEVVVRIEYLSEADLKWTLSAMHCMEVIGLVVLLLVLLAKLRQGNAAFIANNTLNVVNTAVGGAAVACAPGVLLDLLPRHPRCQQVCNCLSLLVGAHHCTHALCR